MNAVEGLDATDCTGVIQRNADVQSIRKEPPGADTTERPPLPIYPQQGDLPNDTTRTES